MGGWGNLADVRVNTSCGVRTETYGPLPLSLGHHHFLTLATLVKNEDT